MHGPVLAVCGWSGAGKTTLLEAALPRLVARGLAVAVVKHDAHGLDIDRPGKDSDRLFRAGADVALGGPGEHVTRTHGEGSLDAVVRRALEAHDVVLVEGHKATPLPKLWLASEDGAGPPPDVASVLEVLARDGLRPGRFEAFVDEWLPGAWTSVPALGAVLFGGRSSRMGSPKQLLADAGASFAERVHGALAARLAPVVFLGSGALPAALAPDARVADPPGAQGPLAGVIAALRWAPGHAVVVAACDQPRFAPEAVDWLLAQRRPGTWAVLPRRAGPADGAVEPLGALYEPQARALLEPLLAAGGRGPRAIAGHPKVAHPLIPEALASCWTSIDTPDDLARLGDPC